MRLARYILCLLVRDSSVDDGQLAAGGRKHPAAFCVLSFRPWANFPMPCLAGIMVLAPGQIRGRGVFRGLGGLVLAVFFGSSIAGAVYGLVTGSGMPAPPFFFFKKKIGAFPGRLRIDGALHLCCGAIGTGGWTPDPRIPR